MNLIADIIIVLGLVSLLLLVVGIWTQLDLRKKPREAEAGETKPEEKK